MPGPDITARPVPLTGDASPAWERKDAKAIITERCTSTLRKCSKVVGPEVRPKAVLKVSNRAVEKDQPKHKAEEETKDKALQEGRQDGDRPKGR